ncbi:hypothetical protein BAU15_07215 [Enterococcus sp. JM4C]|uniref:response regulator transcription factor n=1 Tax=Candidatus Enterococcus huntleyi TaxID=1857217 RepID=UPI0013794704|nr:response regulator transcription factor [Enterococcus sp. JM4C]KAF1297497.1 hypothetical protein BAU15_07215 [Enterococcus sp. JM4C]
MKIAIKTNQEQTYQELRNQINEVIPDAECFFSNSQQTDRCELLLVMQDLLTENWLMYSAEWLTQRDYLQIALVEKEDAASIVDYLEQGADFVWVWPANLEELIRRIAVLQLWKKRDDVDRKFVFNAGELVILNETKQVFFRDSEINLTSSEFQILLRLAEHPFRIYSRDDLLLLIGNDSGMNRVVDTHIKNLRKKMEIDPRNPRYIQTVHGRGYRFGIKRTEG